MDEDFVVKDLIPMGDKFVDTEGNIILKIIDGLFYKYENGDYLRYKVFKTLDLNSI